MLKRLLIAALAAFLPFTVSASCMSGGDNWAEPHEHYAYWTTTEGETWHSRYGGCWITIEDESYHNTDQQALACGDAVEAQTVVFVRVVVLFPTDVHVMNDNQVANLKDFIAHLRAQGIPVETAIVAGHTDSTHTDEYNMALGDRRAKTLAAALAGHGIKVLNATSFGEHEPVETNETAEGRQQNRRAEGTLSATVQVILRK